MCIVIVFTSDVYYVVLSFTLRRLVNVQSECIRLLLNIVHILFTGKCIVNFINKSLMLLCFLLLFHSMTLVPIIIKNFTLGVDNIRFFLIRDPDPWFHVFDTCDSVITSGTPFCSPHISDLVPVMA